MSDIVYLDVGDERNVPHRLVDIELVSYPIEETVTRNGKAVVERSRLEYTIASAKRIEK